MSKTNSHGPKDVRAIEVWLYFILQNAKSTNKYKVNVLKKKKEKKYIGIVTVLDYLVALWTIIDPRNVAWRMLYRTTRGKSDEFDRLKGWLPKSASNHLASPCLSLRGQLAKKAIALKLLGIFW